MSCCDYSNAFCGSYVEIKYGPLKGCKGTIKNICNNKIARNYFIKIDKDKNHSRYIDWFNRNDFTVISKSTPVPSNPISYIFCPICGEKVEHKHNFCFVCGTKLVK